MNRSLGVVIASMLIGLTLPAFGQQGGPENPQQIAEALQAVQEVGRQYVAAYNRQDAAAIASLFAEDAVRVTPYGIIQGREAIRSHFENAFKAGSHDLSDVIRVYRASGTAVWEAGSYTVQVGQRHRRGYFATTFVREGGGFKIRDVTVNFAPPVSGQQPTTE